MGLRWPRPDWARCDCQSELLGEGLVRTYSTCPKIVLLTFRVLCFLWGNRLKLKLANQDKICHFHPNQAPFIPPFLLLFQIAEPIELTDLLVTGVCWESHFEHPPDPRMFWAYTLTLLARPAHCSSQSIWGDPCTQTLVSIHVSVGLLKLCREMIASSILPFRHAQHWRPNAGSLWKHINKERTKPNQDQTLGLIVCSHMQTSS